MKKFCMRYLGKGKIMDQWIRKTDAADHMKEVTNNGVTYLTFPALDATGIVTHAFSTRMGGVSEGWYSTMNFSFTRGDNREHVLENYSRMAAALGVKREKMVLTWQTHTTNIRVVSAVTATRLERMLRTSFMTRFLRKTAGRSFCRRRRA